MGHLLTAEGLNMGFRKVEKWQLQIAKKMLNRLLGFEQFLNQYISRLSKVDPLLRDLENADVLFHFHWNQSQQTRFEKIKKLVSQSVA